MRVNSVDTLNTFLRNHTMTRFCFAVLLAGLLTPLGCEVSSPLPPSPPSTGTVPAGPTPAEIAAATTAIETASAVTLDIKNWDETLALVAQHKGKVVVLDLWSTSCEPCMVEFPHLVELHKQHGDKLVCLSASCDYAGIKSKPPETRLSSVPSSLNHFSSA